MNKNVNFFLKLVGIDKAIFYTIITRLLQAGGGIVMIYFITSFLSKEEQGYYYTFGSIVAIQVFFELGMNTIITQFVAHEFAFLRFENHIIVGDEYNKSRISLLFKFSLKLFSILAFCLFFILFFSGIYFFNRFKHEGINWEGPWLTLSISTTLLFFTSPILAFLEGLGNINEISKIRFYQQLAYLLVIAMSFISGLGLFSISIASFTSAIILVSYIIFKRKILLGITFSSTRANLNFFHEIFPYQWRVAVSWISGYFIFQVFNPVLFATEGPIVAGQMGLTLTVLSGISSLSMSWITTKIQNFSTLISKSEFKKLDELFITSFKQSVKINSLLLIFFVILKITLDTYFITFSNRFLPIIPIILLSLVTLANQFVFSWATYIRCHKSEPFLLNSIIGAALNIASIYFLGHKFGLIGIVVGYFFITIFIGLPWVYIVFKKKKMEWH